MSKWDELTMAEKAEMMKVAVRNGIYNLNDIRQKYNEFAEGGGISDGEYYSTMEKVAEDNYQKWGLNSPDEALVHALNDNTYNYRGYYDKYPQSEANADTHWTDEFKTVYHPTFSVGSSYSGQESQYNPQGLYGGHWVGDKFIPAPWQLSNTFKGGGYKPSDSVKKRISTWEGTAMTGAIDPLSGKWGKNRSFEAEAASFYDALPSNIREHVLSNPELADHLFSYSYNVGAGNFKKRVVPALKKYYTGNGSPEEIANSMWATGDKKLRGLRNRRAVEKKGVVDALTPSFISEPADNTFVFNPFAIQAENTYTRPVVVPDEDSYVTAHEVSPSEQKAQEIKERFDAINRFNTILNMLNMDTSAPTYMPNTGNSFLDAIGVLTNSNANGGKIHIKPENRGKFTALKKRTGHSATWFKQHGTPAQQKLATFALNSRHWNKHALGGYLEGEVYDLPEEEIMKLINAGYEIEYL